MILFLDDDPRRTRRFRSYYPSCSTAATALEMIKLLDGLSETADAVYLDHDLGRETFVDSDRSDCGMEVVRWIVENKPPVREFIVHSLNHYAAQTMVKLLRDSGYDAKAIPFTAFNFD